MKTNLDVALALIADDLPIPTDLAAALIEDGIIIDALEADNAADTSLTIFTASEQ